MSNIIAYSARRIARCLIKIKNSKKVDQKDYIPFFDKNDFVSIFELSTLQIMLNKKFDPLENTKIDFCISEKNLYTYLKKDIEEGLKLDNDFIEELKKEMKKREEKEKEKKERKKRRKKLGITGAVTISTKP